MGMDNGRSGSMITKTEENDKSIKCAGLTLLPKLPIYKTVVAGGTTYFVFSFFKENAKGNVVDKISRLITRDAEYITED